MMDLCVFVLFTKKLVWRKISPELPAPVLAVIFQKVVGLSAPHSVEHVFKGVIAICFVGDIFRTKHASVVAQFICLSFFFVHNLVGSIEAGPTFFALEKDRDRLVGDVLQ